MCDLTVKKAIGAHCRQQKTWYQRFEIVPAGRREYTLLEDCHYRPGPIGPIAQVYAIRLKRGYSNRFVPCAGVIVFGFPTPGCLLRNRATHNLFKGFSDRRQALRFLNRNLRTISRVIIDPRFRGLGLASHLVRATLPCMNVAYVEALAAMGQVNGFFKHAGMREFSGPLQPRCIEMTRALAQAGIDQSQYIYPVRVHQMLSALDDAGQKRINRAMLRFLKPYGKRRNMPPGPDRTGFVLSRLTFRPFYYLWKNPTQSLHDEPAPDQS